MTYVVTSDIAILGVGETEEAAWQDYERHIDTTLPGYSRDSFVCAPATPELIAYVDVYGGAPGISWGRLPDGTHCTLEQERAAKPHFVVCDDTAIWGGGRTEKDAWANWEGNVDRTDPRFAESDPSRDGFSCLPATVALFDLVEEKGGNIQWGALPDGTLCTVDEEVASLRPTASSRTLLPVTQ